MIEPHPFAQFIQILGKGPTMSRPLTEPEMLDAARMVLSDQVEPIQLGAFLCLLRITGETASELAGFVRAARETMNFGAVPDVHLDWPAYAGKKRRMPWFILSALLLAHNNVRVAMHGLDHHTPGRVWPSDALATLGLMPARTNAEVSAQLDRHGIAYVALPDLHPALAHLFSYKHVLGLRSPAHSVARNLNPFGAACQIMGVAHPPYRPLHQETAVLLGQPNAAVLKGEGGEAERVPEKPCEVAGVAGGVAQNIDWPAMLADPRRQAEGYDLSALAALWRGELTDPAAEAVVTGTAAIALHAMGRVATPAEADRLAADMWRNRPANPLPGGAG